MYWYKSFLEIGDPTEQQGLQFRAVLARDCFWAVIWSDLCGYWRKVDDWSLPMPCPALNAASSCLLWIWSHQQGCPVICGPECSWVPQDHDKKVNASLSYDISTTCVAFHSTPIILNELYEQITFKWWVHSTSWWLMSLGFEPILIFITTSHLNMALCLCANSTSGYAL